MGLSQSGQRNRGGIQRSALSKDSVLDLSSLSGLHPSQFVPQDLEIDNENPPAIQPTQGFQVELASSLSMKEIEVELEHPDKFTLYYKEHFAEKGPHLNFVGGTSSEPFVISVQFDKQLPEWKVLIRTRKEDIHMVMPVVGSKSKVLAFLKHCSLQLQTANLVEVKAPKIQSELVHMENRMLLKNYKFGILYCKEGQTLEDDMFSNEHGSKNFLDFLNLMGDKVKLKNWKGYSGELDVHASQSTGTHSVFTCFEGFDVMFHVSTMLPYSSVNAQQIERKRHIGNDIAVIVFQDGDGTMFSPTTITSKYNHVYGVVQLVSPKTKKARAVYRVAFASKIGVRPFGPLIPEKPLFKHGSALKDFLLTKLINGERASYRVPNFGVTRTRKDWLNSFVETYQ